VANQIVTGEKPSTPQQQKQAVKFLNALRDYNEALLDEHKILDSKGRLLNGATATPVQRGLMSNTISAGTTIPMKDEAQAQAAAEVLASEMKDTFESVRDAANRQLKDQ
jgi:hypothetical protein